MIFNLKFRTSTVTQKAREPLFKAASSSPRAASSRLGVACSAPSLHWQPCQCHGASLSASAALRTASGTLATVTFNNLKRERLTRRRRRRTRSQLHPGYLASPRSKDRDSDIPHTP
jgi:hypothetical protein